MMTTVSVSANARQLLERVNDDTRRPQCADDLLVFLYFLQDNTVIVDSTRSVLKAKSFHALGTIIHDLEARPDQALEEPSQRSFLAAVLKDLATGALKVKGNT